MQQPELPQDQVAPEGRDVIADLETARERIGSRPDRDSQTGRFVAGNGAAAVTRGRSAAFWAEVAIAKAEIMRRVLSDLAASDEPTEVLAGVVEAYAEAKLLRRSLFLDITAAGGTTTTKNHARRLLTPYGAAFDRELKAAHAIGLTRRARIALDLPIDELLRQQPEGTE